MKKFNSCIVVDDEPELLETLKDGLEELFNRVDTCRDGLEAIDKLSKNTYDLIVSDIQMPYVKGDELLDKLRIKGIRTPFVYMTGKGSISLLAEGRDVGVVEYVEKPFAFKAFLARIERVMEIMEIKKTFES